MNVASERDPRERTIVAVDPGLATFGLVTVRTDGDRHRCIRAEVSVIPPDPRRAEVEVADDRARRARELSRWLDAILTLDQPCVVAAESMSFPRGTHAIAAICLGWGVLCDQLENRRIPLVHAGPKEWRRAVCGVPSEQKAHMVALKAVPSFADMARGISRRDVVHAKDALGIMLWSLQTNTVRMALGSRR